MKIEKSSAHYLNQQFSAYFSLAWALFLQILLATTTNKKLFLHRREREPECVRVAPRPPEPRGRLPRPPGGSPTPHPVYRPSAVPFTKVGRWWKGDFLQPLSLGTLGRSRSFAGGSCSCRSRQHFLCQVRRTRSFAVPASSPPPG